MGPHHSDSPMELTSTPPLFFSATTLSYDDIPEFFLNVSNNSPHSPAPPTSGWVFEVQAGGYLCLTDFLESVDMSSTPTQAPRKMDPCTLFMVQGLQLLCSNTPLFQMCKGNNDVGLHVHGWMLFHGHFTHGDPCDGLRQGPVTYRQVKTWKFVICSLERTSTQPIGPDKPCLESDAKALGHVASLANVVNELYL